MDFIEFISEIVDELLKKFLALQVGFLSKEFTRTYESLLKGLVNDTFAFIH